MNTKRSLNDRVARRALPLLALLLFPAIAAAQEPASFETVQRFVQRGEYAKAKAVARSIVRARAQDETAWLVYEAVIREELRHELGAPRDAALTPGESAVAVPPRAAAVPRPAALPDDADRIDPLAVVPGPAVAPPDAPDPAPGSRDAAPRTDAEPPAAAEEPEIAVDFRRPDDPSPVSVALGGPVTRDPQEGLVFPAKGGGTIALSFDLKRFPRAASLELFHRVDGKAGLARMAPLTVTVNDKPLFIRKVAVKSRAGESAWPCTNLLKAGANVIEIGVSELPVRYYLRSVRIRSER